MSEFLSPGIFIEEVNANGQTIQAVGTSTMAVVGFTQRGPVNQALLVTSPTSYNLQFGDIIPNTLVPMSVSAFFTNGGTRCYVVRVVPADAATAQSAITEGLTGEIPGTTPGSTISPVEDGAALGPFTIQLAHIPLTSDVVTVHWNITGPTAHTATITGASTIGGANAAGVASANLNRTTGLLTITFASGNAPLAASITIDYGAILWTMSAHDPGAWGNDLRVTIQGNGNFFGYAPPGVSGAGVYSKFNVIVSLFDDTAQAYIVKEQYEELSFTDPTDVLFAPLAINDASNFIILNDLGNHMLPPTFTGVQHSAVSVGAGTGSLKVFTTTLANFPFVLGSVLVHYTIGSVAYTAMADASGNFTQTSPTNSALPTDIDQTKTNNIDFTTGVITLNFTVAPDNTTNVTADYISSPTTTSINYAFTNGLNGSLTPFPNANFGRVQFTSPTLQANKRGMFALDRVDEMMQLVIPDFAGDPTIAGDQVDYADVRGDIFVILSTPKGQSAQQAVNYVRLTFATFSRHSAIYWPWLLVADPAQNNRNITVPPIAHVAGVYARTDVTRNVGKAPGGTVDGALKFLVGLEHNPDKGERDTVSPARINSLINSPQTGMAVWGVRSLSADSQWKYINAVRLFMFVEKSVYNSTFQYVFEPITNTLYTQIKSQLDSFLLNLFGLGYFAGATATNAFFVKCDTENNPQDVVDAGQVIIDVGIAPNKPAEFIIFRFQQQQQTG